MVSYELEGRLIELRYTSDGTPLPPGSDVIVAVGTLLFDNKVKVEFPIRDRDLPGWLERFGTKIWSEWCLTVDKGRGSPTRVGERISMKGPLIIPEQRRLL